MLSQLPILISMEALHGLYFSPHVLELTTKWLLVLLLARLNPSPVGLQ